MSQASPEWVATTEVSVAGRVVDGAVSSRIWGAICLR